MGDAKALGVLRLDPRMQPAQTRKPVCSAVELRPETRRKLAYSWLRGTPINNLAKITSREYGIPIKSFEVESAVRDELRPRPTSPGGVVPLVRRAA